jgi:hypothetical protein
MYTEDSVTSENSLLVVNISYSNKFRGNYDESSICPTSMILDIPNKILEQQDKENYLDIIESFVYTTISGKIGREVSFCQIYFQ